MPDRALARPDRFSTVLLALLLGVGLYFPTSAREIISVNLYLVTAAILLSILMALLMRRGGVIGPAAVMNVVVINLIILICTLFSPFTEFAYGGYIPILLISVLFCVRVKEIPLTIAARRLFDAANVINLILAGLLLLPAPAVTQFFLDHYAYGYDELVPYMLEEGKAVLTFGSHSLAGFFYYLLFYLNLETYKKAPRKLNLVFAVCYLALLVSLSSFTALIFAGVAAVQLVLRFQWHRSPVAGFATCSLLLAAAFIAPSLQGYSDFKENLADVWSREENGLLGRYSSTGGLSANLEFIVDHPFSPIGLGLSSQLWYSDSGPVEYLLKGSFPLLFTMYLGAFLFFYKNLRSKRRAIFLFLVFLGFEAGYSNLEYIRTQCFLPFLLVYANWLDQAPGSQNA